MVEVNARPCIEEVRGVSGVPKRIETQLAAVAVGGYSTFSCGLYPVLHMSVASPEGSKIVPPVLLEPRLP